MNEPSQDALPENLQEVMLRVFERISQRFDSTGRISGLTTGLRDLDAAINGLNPAELVIVAARPGMGKTALAMTMAHAVATKADTGAILFSLDEVKIELAERLLCIHGQLDGHHIRNGDIGDDERDRLMQASADLADIPLFIDDVPARSLDQICQISRRCHQVEKVGLIVIDCLQSIKPENASHSREDQLAQIVRGLKALAKELCVPVVVVSQVDQGPEKRIDKRPRLAEVPDAIGQYADVVMFLFRHTEPDQPNRVAELIIAKNRRGRASTVLLTWICGEMRFADHSGERPL